MIAIIDGTFELDDQQELVAAVPRDLARPVGAVLQLETVEGNDAVDAD